RLRERPISRGRTYAHDMPRNGWRHREPTGRANARPMTGTAKQSRNAQAEIVWIASAYAQGRFGGLQARHSSHSERRRVVAMAPVLVHAHNGRIDHLHRRVMTGGQRSRDPLPNARPPPLNKARYGD